MNYYELTGNKDVDTLLLSQLNNYDLVQACQLSQYTNSLCTNKLLQNRIQNYKQKIIEAAQIIDKILQDDLIIFYFNKENLTDFLPNTLFNNVNQNLIEGQIIKFVYDYDYDEFLISYEAYYGKHDFVHITSALRYYGKTKIENIIDSNPISMRRIMIHLILAYPHVVVI